MKIYVARSRSDYETIYEEKAFGNIKRKWEGCSIIEFPVIEEEMKKGKNFFKLEFNTFFPLISECDIFIILPVCNEKGLKGVEKRGSISTGVQHEMKFAKRIGKKILIYNETEFRELVDTTVTEVDRNGVDGNGTKLKRMTTEERIYFYKHNPMVAKEMIDWCKLDSVGGKRNGMRCVALRPDNEKYSYVYRDIRSVYGYALSGLNEGNFVNRVKFARTIEFLPYIFDIGITQCMRKADVLKYIIGVTYVIDIDSPDIDENDKSKGRFDLLDFELIDYMNDVVGHFKDELIDVGEWNNCRKTFTGNGVNIILGSYYDNGIEISKFINGMIGLVKDVREMTNCSVHVKKPGWNSNYKIPGTFHFTNNKLVSEIDKNKDLNLDELIKKSNPYNTEVYKW